MFGKVIDEFQDNLKDWCAGGPKKGGWTRRGFPVILPPVRLTGCRFEDVDIDDALAKNRFETDRWHLHYLRYYTSGRPFSWKKSNYYWEYLSSRYDDKEGKKRALHFLELFDDIEENGLRKPVWLADIACLDLDFRYFRFDGCHRMCCWKILGHNAIPAVMFKAERCD
jgi:hypothetical protein